MMRRAENTQRSKRLAEVLYLAGKFLSARTKIGQRWRVGELAKFPMA